MATKFIFVTGGVVSSLGKGISASAIGQILKSRGLKVFTQKFDPYINVDPGTMSPFQHGEVFVTDDGAETDLDLGHYERFIDINLTKESSITTGKIYQNVINKERRGDYLGATVQVIPHVTDEIKLKLKEAAQISGADVIITEIGGTVGDIESLPYLEAIRQARRDFGYKNTLYIHNTLVPFLKASNEIKTKPTQHSVKELRSLGIQPDIIILRSEVNISSDVKEKIALFCDVDKEAVFESLDVNVIYESILNFRKQKIDDYILKHFQIDNEVIPDMSSWEDLIERIKTPQHRITIGLVGKYVTLQDAYLSVSESLKHAGFYHHCEVKIKWLNAEKLTSDNYEETLKSCDGILVPGGFGKRATSGKLLAIQYAREHNIPFFGICYGMQLAIIEYARNVLGYKEAETTEIDPNTKMPLIHILEAPGTDLGGTLRLGLYDCKIEPNTVASKSYGHDLIKERHRHRYEFNNQYKALFNDNNFIFSGINPERNLVEIIELKNHFWFVGVQYHPEFLSRPLRPHPLFRRFIEMSLKNNKIKQ
jgi:CTP synthase